MAARRMRFTKGERAVFAPGADVEVLNGTRWRAARVTGGFAVDSVGYEYVSIVVPGLPGACRGYAKGIRLVDREGAYV